MAVDAPPPDEGIVEEGEGGGVAPGTLHEGALLALRAIPPPLPSERPCAPRAPSCRVKTRLLAGNTALAAIVARRAFTGAPIRGKARSVSDAMGRSPAAAVFRTDATRRGRGCPGGNAPQRSPRYRLKGDVAPPPASLLTHRPCRSASSSVLPSLCLPLLAPPRAACNCLPRWIQRDSGAMPRPGCLTAAVRPYDPALNCSSCAGWIAGPVIRGLMHPERAGFLGCGCLAGPAKYP
jgi:hypothetical protein